MGLKLLDLGAGLEPRAALSASFKAAAAHVRSSAGGALLSRGCAPQQGVPPTGSETPPKVLSGIQTQIRL